MNLSLLVLLCYERPLVLEVGFTTYPYGRWAHFKRYVGFYCWLVLWVVEWVFVCCQVSSCLGRGGLGVLRAVRWMFFIVFVMSFGGKCRFS